MRRLIAALFGLLALATLAHGQGIPNFPQTLPGDTVVGRLSTAGPSEAIPFANFLAGITRTVSATSATSNLISVASKTFTTQAGKAFVANQWVLVYSRSNNANVMLGQITSYSGTTLVVNVAFIGGSGTLSDWNIALANSFAAAGVQPPAGGTGNVVGPGSSVTGNLPAFGDTSGKVLVDSGIAGTVGKPYTPVNLQINASVATNILTIALKAADTGADPTSTHPVVVPVRDTTLANGDPVYVSVTGALSINTNAVGATLGSSNNVPFRFWIGLFNNAGTGVLGLFNASTQSGTIQIFPLTESGLASTTAISGAATAAGTWYTPNGTTLSSKAFRIIGYLEYSPGLATAGTYATAPTKIQIFGPGNHLPGAVIQTIYSSTTTPTTVNSTAKVATALVGTLTPTSAINLIKVVAFGSFDSGGTGGIGAGANAQIYRNTGTTAIGSTAPFDAGGSGRLNTVTTNFVLDNPQSTSSTQYGVYIADFSGTATNIFLGTGDSGTQTGAMIIEEIQG